MDTTGRRPGKGRLGFQNRMPGPARRHQTLTDREQLETRTRGRIAWDLVGNAARHTEPGDGIGLCTDNSDPNAYLEIGGSEPFRRMDTGDASTIAWTGPSTARSIVTAHRRPHRPKPSPAPFTPPSATSTLG
jgi:hypothetical protein